MDSSELGRDASKKGETAGIELSSDDPARTATYPDSGPVNAVDTIMNAPVYIYALGTIEPRFPTLSVEKEFAQVTGRADTAGLTDREALHEVLSARENRYLIPQLCWVLTIEGLDTYILQAQGFSDYDLLLEAVRPRPRPTDVDVVIGVRGPIAPPEMCNGLMIPLVGYDQIYSFDVDSLIESLPSPDYTSEDGGEEEQFQATAEELFYRIMQMADNAGATDEYRALNYLAVRYPRIYHRTAELFRDDFSLTRIDVQPSPLSSTRNIVDVVFSYTNRQSNVDERYFVRVDVTGEWPFLVTELSPYYSR